MDELTLAALCRLYSLGMPQAVPTRVFGGLLHQMYRLKTARGEFAVKVLNPTIMQYADVRANFRRSERIASAVSAVGLPAVPALEAVGDVIHDIGLMTVMAFLWINAQALSTGPAPPDQSRQIGSILGRIHALPLRFHDMPPPERSGPFNPEYSEWALLVDQAEKKQIAWAQEVRPMLPEIDAWIRASYAARLAVGDRWVISHSDLDQKNVLWSNAETPWLIDWECAGWVQPAMEAVGAALDWSGQVFGEFHAAAYEAFLNGYRREMRLTAEEERCGQQAYRGNWCGWLKFNMKRSLGRGVTHPDEQSLGLRETLSTLAMLRSVGVTLPGLMTAS